MKNVARIYLVVFGPMSKAELIPENELQAFMKQLPADERDCALVTETDMTSDELDFLNRTRVIIERCEHEITEAKDRARNYLKSRKKTA